MRKNSLQTGNPGFVIVGNMNVGKTTIFEHLCRNRFQEISLPGTKFSLPRGIIKGTSTAVYDTPGTLSLFSHNEDEVISNYLMTLSREQCRGIILVADAKKLKRSISLFFQYAEYKLPMILVLNMIDEAESRGIRIDLNRLSKQLGVDVVTTIASEGIGVPEIISKLGNIKLPKPHGTYPEPIPELITQLGQFLPEPIVAVTALLLATNNPSVKAALGVVSKDRQQQILADISSDQTSDSIPLEIKLDDLYNGLAQKIIDKVQTSDPHTPSQFREILGEWCIDPKTGIPIAMVVVVLMYYFVGAFGATFMVDTINSKFFGEFLIPVCDRLVQKIPNLFIRDLIMDPQFGILPTGVFLALGLVLPVLFCFYIFFGFLEDSGYLSRISILLDKIFQILGLNGKGVMPIVMGFSCITMAILTTRMLDSKREKNIATFLLIFGIPCAPLLSVMLIILEDMPISATITIFGIIAAQILIGGLIANKFISGTYSPLLMEIPPLRLPKPATVIKRSAIRTLHFMREAIPIFILASMTVFLFDRIGGLALLEVLLSPLINDLMGLPNQSVQVFMKTIIRRESGATEIENLKESYTNLQLVVNLLVMTFLIPCLNAIIVMGKERGLKTTGIIISAVVVYATLVGTLVNHICLFFGITFT